MAKEKKETAEQKLLKIIENGKKDESEKGKPAEAGAESTAQEAKAPETSKTAEEMAASVKGGGIAELGLPVALDPVLAIFKKFGFSPKTFSLREANMLFAIVAFALCVIFILTVRGGMSLTQKGIKIEIGNDETSAFSSVNAIPKYRQVAAYLENIKQRNIFQPYEEKIVEKQAPEPVEAKRIETVIKNLKLVGISWFETPETAAAMIEDTISGTTYFIQQGERIRNVEVKTIFADRVILSYQGEETDMRLQ